MMVAAVSTSSTPIKLNLQGYSSWTMMFFNKLSWKYPSHLHQSHYTFQHSSETMLKPEHQFTVLQHHPLLHAHCIKEAILRPSAQSSNTASRRCCVALPLHELVYLVTWIQWQWPSDRKLVICQAICHPSWAYWNIYYSSVTGPYTDSTLWTRSSHISGCVHVD